MTAAQKLAKENFKKAIAYRKISGCTLKEAFAKIYNKKTAPIKKAASKVKKLVKKAKDAYYEGYNEAARKSNPLMVKKRKVGAVAKKKAVKKAAPKKVARKVVKKAAPKRSVSLHKDTKSHNVNIRVISGMESVAIGNVKYLFEQIRKAEGQFQILKDRKKRDKKLVGFDAKLFQRYPGYIKSLKKQLTEAKKNIK
jgi:hypothetical protein